MRVAAILFIAVGLFAAGQAQLDTSALADAGKALVDGLVEQGKKLLTDAATDFLTKFLTGDSIFGKRDLSHVAQWVKDTTDKMKTLADKGKAAATTAFSDALAKLKALSDRYHALIGSVEDADGILAKIDAVVNAHHDTQKRVVEDLVQTGKDLLAGAYNKAKELAQKLKGHASELVSGLLQKGVDVFGKRQLTDHLQKIADALSTVVSPFKDAVSGLGDTLKGHFSNLVDTVKGHADALKTKLDPHLSDLKDHGQTLLGHGKNALNALSDVVSDILNQTVDNAGDSLSGIAKTLGDAGSTVVGHLSGTDSE